MHRHHHDFCFAAKCQTALYIGIVAEGKGASILACPEIFQFLLVGTFYSKITQSGIENPHFLRIWGQN